MLNVSPEPGIQSFGVYDGPSPPCQSDGEMDQVEAVECAETKVRDKQIDRTVREGGPGVSKLRYASHVGQIGNGVVEPQPEQCVWLDQ